MEPLKVLKWYRDTKLAEETEREVWLRCYNYINNWVDGQLGQWTSDSRSVLKAQQRPVISFNHVRKFVNRLCGAQRQAKADEKAYPRDDQADYMVADIFTDLLKFVSQNNNLESERAKIFRDMVAIGRGFERAEWSDELDDLGEIKACRINPFRVYLIGSHERYDLMDRDAIIEELPMTKEAIISRWEKAKDGSDTEEELESLMKEGEDGEVIPSGGDDYEWKGGVPADLVFDKDLKKFTVLRTQRVAWKDALFIENPETGERKLAEANGVPLKKKEAKLAADTMYVTTGTKFKVITKKVRYIELTYSIGHILLQEEDSGWKTWDITGYFCYTDNGKITGIVQDLLDPQDEKNKRHAQIMHILGTASKNNHFVKKGAIDDLDSAETRIGSVGKLIEVNGNPKDVMTPIISDLSAVPAIINQDLQSTQEMKEISGLGDASLGQVPEGVKSGRGIQALQGPSETIVSELFDNFFFSRKLASQKIIYLMQRYYTQERRFRILGDYSPRFVPPELQLQVAAGLIELQEGQKLIMVNKQMGEQKLNDITVGKYDVVIDQISQNPTTRRAQYFDLINMKGMGAPVSWRRIINASDVRDKQGIIADIPQEEMRMALQAQANAEPQRQASQSKAVETDLQGNVAGAQF